jgi:hypothetical protein
MKATFLRVTSALALLLTTACQSSRYYDARYFPAPLEREVHADALPGSQVRALITVLGVARANSDEGRPKQVELRLRLENLGTIPATLVEKDLSLVSADIVPFGPPRILSPGDLTVPPAESRQFDVAFQAPPNEVDWTALNLRFGLLFDTTAVVMGATFTRQTYYYADPAFHVGFGYANCW